MDDRIKFDEQLAEQQIDYESTKCQTCGSVMPPNFRFCPKDNTRLPLADRATIPSYHFVRYIASGGMGVIYEAQHQFLKKPVAVKMMHNSTFDDAHVLRFQQEASAASKINHPNIVAVQDCGLTTLGEPYMVLDFVQGGTLADFIKAKGSCNIKESVQLALQLCEGMNFAHKAGIIHRDLKPSNVLISTDKNQMPLPMISDFGIAKLVETKQSAVQLTKTGEIFGSPQYMSPEQASGEKVDYRSDIYSLGCILFEMLTGAPPFIGDNLVTILYRQISEKPPSMAEASLGKEIPQELEMIVSRSLEKNPDDRFASMTEFRDALAATLVPKPIEQMTKLGVPPRKIIKKKKDGKSLVAAGAGLSCLAIMAFFWMQSTKPLKTTSNDTLQQPSSVSPTKEPFTLKPTEEASQQTAATKKKEAPDRLLDTPPSFVSPEDMVTARIRAATDTLDLTHQTLYDSSALDILKTKTELRTLILKGAQFDNASVKYFSLLPLTSLNIAETAITDDGVCQLKGMKNTLEKLNIDHQKIGAKGVAYISNMPNLMSLNAANNDAFNDSCIPLLAKMQKLNNLNLSKDYYFHADGLKYLLKLPLSTLTIESIPAPPSYLNTLASIPTLTSLDISGTLANDQTAEALSKHPFHSLKIVGCKMTPACLNSIGRCKTLVTLDISGFRNATASQISALVNLKNLTRLDLNDMQVGGEYAAVLEQMKSLKVLRLTRSVVSRQVLEGISKLPHLQELDLQKADVSDAQIAPLRASSIESLNLSETLITDHGLLALAACKNLSALTIGRCKFITESGLKKFISANKNPNIAIAGTSFEENFDRLSHRERNTP